MCRGCRKKIVYIRPPFCMKCGKQLVQKGEEYCRDCQKKMHLYTQGTSLYFYGSMADSLFRFKYGGRREYALFFGKELYEKRKNWLLSLDADALLPVPVHAARKRKRGYNQAELLAKVLSKYSGIPVAAGLVARVKKTMPQRELGVQERQNNLKKAFKIMKNDVKLDTIVIVDDIYTTGSTVDAIAELLQKAGAKRIYYMALAAGRSD